MGRTFLGATGGGERFFRAAWFRYFEIWNKDYGLKSIEKEWNGEELRLRF